MLVTCTRCNRMIDTGSATPGDVVRCGCGLGIMVPEPPAVAGKMNCPACGAPVDPEAARCEFCDTKLATVICPSCFGVVFDGSRHCLHCGTALAGRQVIHHGDQTVHGCPRCAEHPKLRVEVVAGAPLERCQVCEGLWVDREAVERIYRDREHAVDIGALAASTKGAAVGAAPVKGTTGSLPRAEGYIPCPECGKMMNRQNFGRTSGVIIDLCKEHGTWFDADELRRILEFIAAGGLAKAAERERMELKEELRWLRTKRRLEETRDSGQRADLGGGRLLAGRSALAIGGLLRKLF